MTGAQLQTIRSSTDSEAFHRWQVVALLWGFIAGRTPDSCLALKIVEIARKRAKKHHKPNTSPIENRRLCRPLKTPLRGATLQCNREVLASLLTTPDHKHKCHYIDMRTVPT